MTQTLSFATPWFGKKYSIFLTFFQWVVSHQVHVVDLFCCPVLEPDMRGRGGGEWRTKCSPKIPFFLYIYILQEFLVTVVCLKGCGVRFLMLQSSPCLLHPPCNYKEVGKNCRMRQIWKVCVVYFKQDYVSCDVMTQLLRIMQALPKARGLSTNSHYSIHSSTITLPHASEPRLSAYVPYLRAEVTIHTLAKQALVSHDKTLLDYLKWFLYRHEFSHTFIVTLPFVTFRILKPTVGIMSSLNWPDCRRKMQGRQQWAGE